MIRDTDLIRYPDSLCPQANHNWPGQLRAGLTRIAIFLSTYQSAARARIDARCEAIFSARTPNSSRRLRELGDHARRMRAHLSRGVRIAVTMCSSTALPADSAMRR
nr:hypothetical protein [Burkholderia ubonensis]